MTESALTSVQNGVGRITLNRPKALNALNRVMCEIMTDALMAWREDDTVRTILIDHAGERGFCAGGDIRMIAESGAGNAVEAKAFFLTEYRLNHLMVVYPKPIIAVMDGIVMGGGVGISDPAVPHRHRADPVRHARDRHRPVSRCRWRLFSPRMPGETGIRLALTGARIGGGGLSAAGSRNPFHRVGSDRGLQGGSDPERRAAGGHCLALCREGASPLDPYREAMDRCFALRRWRPSLPRWKPRERTGPRVR